MQTNTQSRDVFYVSDGTAITCETLGHVVLGQFSFISNEKTFPFVETPDKALDVVKEIESSFQRNGVKPLVFFSIEFRGLPKLSLKIMGAFTILSKWGTKEETFAKDTISKLSEVEYGFGNV